MQNKFLIKKKFITIFAITAVLNITIFATPYFSGQAGFGSQIQAEQNSKNPELLLDGFFSGQFDISPFIMLRLSCSLYTNESMFGQPLFVNKEASFSLEELSITYRSFLGKVAQFVSIYAGEYDPIGSDIFLQRQFGIGPFSSKLTDTICGVSSSSIFNNSGIGAAYSIRIPGNVIFGASAYYNTVLKVTTASVTNDQSMNVDFRFTGAWPRIALDFVFGVTMPMTDTTTEAGKKAYIVERGDLHLGLTAFFGSSNASSFLFQAGIKSIIVDRAALAQQQAVSLDNVFILAEPRFVTKNLCFSFSFYNMPLSNIADLYYISNPTGICLSIYSPWLVINSNRCQFGIIADVSCKETLDNIILVKGTFKENLAFAITPYGYVKFGNGTMNYSLSIDTLSINNWDSFLHSLKIIIGYKTKF